MQTYEVGDNRDVIMVILVSMVKREQSQYTSIMTFLMARSAEIMRGTIIVPDIRFMGIVTAIEKYWCGCRFR